jgi:hypothetical protein
LGQLGGTLPIIEKIEDQKVIGGIPTGVQIEE